MQNFKDKVVVVTGGSVGIGRAIVDAFHDKGAKVVIVGRDQTKLDLCTLPGILKVQGDVSKLSDLGRLYRETEKAFGRIDILIANAGIAEPRVVQEVDEEFFDQMVAINFKGLYFTVQKAIPFLNRDACVILISSAAAHMAWPAQSVYSATKAAVSHLSQTLSADLIPQGIRVNAISPGFVDSTMFSELKLHHPEMIENLNQNIPVRRFAHPDEIANAALFIASASYMVGADLVLDGGMSTIFPAK